MPFTRFPGVEYAATPPLATQADMTGSTQAAFDFPLYCLGSLIGCYTCHAYNSQLVGS